jgi:hypothetical protein
VEVGLSGEGGRRWWYRFDTLVLAREWRRQDESLLKDEADAASSSWLHEKKA